VCSVLIAVRSIEYSTTGNGRNARPVRGIILPQIGTTGGTKYSTIPFILLPGTMLRILAHGGYGSPANKFITRSMSARLSRSQYSRYSTVGSNAVNQIRKTG
jgi:hypothetical protein